MRCHDEIPIRVRKDFDIVHSYIKQMVLVDSRMLLQGMISRPALTRADDDGCAICERVIHLIVPICDHTLRNGSAHEHYTWRNTKYAPQQKHHKRLNKVEHVQLRLPVSRAALN